MHWVLQNNIFNERAYAELVEVLDRGGISYSIHKVVPFIGEIEPDIDPTGNVIVFGSYSMRHVAKRKGWVPGCFDLGDLTYADHVARWGNHMLNADAIYCTFADVPSHIDDVEFFFLRPVTDTKVFSGKVFEPREFNEWYDQVVVLEEDDGNSLRASTPVMISAPKAIVREYRLWVVDGSIVTASLYKRGSQVFYSSDVEDEVLDFARERIAEWQPARAFVVDVAMIATAEGARHAVIETNTINAAGLYAANVGKIVDAIERMTF